MRLPGTPRTPPGTPPGTLLAALLNRLSGFFRLLIHAKPDAVMRRRLALWLPLCFVFGIILYFDRKTEPDYQIALALTGLLWGIAWLIRRYMLVLPVLALAFGLSGFSIAALRTHWLEMPQLTEKRGPLWLSGRIIQIENRDFGPRVTMDHLWYDGMNDPNMPCCLRLSARGDMIDGVAVGDWVRALAVITPASAPFFPGDFDYQRYLYFLGLQHGIGGTGFILKPTRPMHPPQHYSEDFLIKVTLMRARIAENVRRVLDGDRAAIATALIAGDQSSIGREAMQSMRDSGLAHILSISGLHIGMMGLITYYLLRAGMALIPRLSLNYNTKIWALAASVVPVTFYSILAGLAQVPVLRSLVMSLLLLAALMLGRQSFSMRVVGIAALICMLAFPDQLLGASLQMSFAAVVGLMAVAETGIARRLMAKARSTHLIGRILFGVMAAFITSLVATLATAPSSAYSFNRVAVYGAVANLLVIPVTDFVMIPCVALSLLLMPFDSADWVLKLFGLTIDYMLAIANWAAKIPGAVLTVPPISDGAFLAMMMGGLFLCIWVGKWRWLGLAGVMGGVVAVALTEPPDLVIEQNGKLIVLRHPEFGTVFSRPRVSYIMESSLVTALYRPRGPNLPEVAAKPNAGVMCDEARCMIDLFPTRVIWINNMRGFDGVCTEARDDKAILPGQSPGQSPGQKPILLITPFPRPTPCPNITTFYDGEMLNRSGAVALWLNTLPVRSKNVAEIRGNRPWVVQPSDSPESD